MKKGFLALNVSVIAISFGAFVVGLFLGDMSGAMDFITKQFSLSSLGTGLITSIIMIGCLLGALFGGSLSDRYGRKSMLIISNIILAIAAMGSAFSWNLASLATARFIAGLGMGVLSAVIPIYLSEISPARLRGTYVSFYQLFITIGILIAYCTDYWMVNCQNNWRLMLGLPACFALLTIIAGLGVSESPRWLMKTGNDEKAQKILDKLSIPKDEIAEMKNIVPQQKTRFADLFKGRTGKIVLLGSLLAVFQQITGINVMINYAPKILSETGIGGDMALMQAIYVGIVNLVFTIVAVWLVDKLGRRPLLLTGCCGLIASLAYLSVAFSSGDNINNIGILIAILAYIAFFAVSLSPLMFVVTAEIYPSSIRGTAMSLSTGISWLCAYIVVQFFPLMQESLGSSIVFLIFGLLCLAAFLFIFFKIPETKGKSLEQIESELFK